MCTHTRNKRKLATGRRRRLCAALIESRKLELAEGETFLKGLCHDEG